MGIEYSTRIDLNRNLDTETFSYTRVNQAKYKQSSVQISVNNKSLFLDLSGADAGFDKVSNEEIILALKLMKRGDEFGSNLYMSDITSVHILGARPENCEKGLFIGSTEYDIDSCCNLRSAFFHGNGFSNKSPLPHEMFCGCHLESVVLDGKQDFYSDTFKNTVIENLYSPEKINENLLDEMKFSGSAIKELHVPTEEQDFGPQLEQ